MPGFMFECLNTSKEILSLRITRPRDAIHVPLIYNLVLPILK